MMTNAASNSINNKATPRKSKGERFFDRFILAGLLMNVIVVLLLVGVWAYKTFM